MVQSIGTQTRPVRGLLRPAPSGSGPGALAPDSWSASSAGSSASGATSTSQPGFAYDGVPLPDLMAARTWTADSDSSVMSGTQANQVVTRTYQALDQAMTAYLGDPPVPNWTTFGKYASNQVGTEIVRMEAMLTGASLESPATILEQAHDFLQHPSLLGKEALALLKASKTPEATLANVKLLRDALVYGNTAVYSDIAPAFDIFLRAQAQGQDGVAALKAAGFGHAPRDVQGFMLQAFENYQAARQAGDQAQAAKTPAQRQALLARRQNLVYRATLLLGIHEQMINLQTSHVFGNPQVAKLMADQMSSMSIQDAFGTTPLLPNGGNWANFADRMGFVEVPRGKGDYTVVDPAGTAHDYVLNPDAARRQGSIAQYFQENMSPDRAKVMIQGIPAPLPTAYFPGVEVRHDLGRVLDSGPVSWARSLWQRIA